MKFAKRLASEASRKVSFAAAYFDYRAAKKAIKDDIHKSDVAGSSFQELLESELRKVSQFYSEAADRIEATLQSLGGPSGGGSAQQLSVVRAEIKELIKFVALNYLAVVKAIKKRNRHLKETFGASASISLQALDMLGHEVFFTSPRLAHLATQADVLSSASGLAASAAAGACCVRAAAIAQPTEAGAVLEDYQCPICLDTLHNPVVLTCAHRFCWGCLVAHVTAVRDQQLPLAPAVQDGKATDAGSSATNSLQLLERIAAQDDSEGVQRFYNCPVCRKPQLLDVDSLSVDPFLSSFIESLKVLSVNGGPGAGVTAAMAPQAPVLPPSTVTKKAASPSERAWGILPPQRPEHAGRLCVLLDLDGTLVSSYTPRRAPRLPPYVRTHVVGMGSKLNPGGVFVVERPGLREFLEELSSFAEVVIFTAGLEDYAKPIVDALDPRGNLFAHRIYREGTLRTEYYQCVKDMARVGRDLRRTVLVDDTPLAFLHQPDNGVPVLGFRGDPDDRLLQEAVLPLMQVLSKEADVRHVLQRRFDMTTWFRRNSFPIDTILEQAKELARTERERHLGSGGCAATASLPPPASPMKPGTPMATGPSSLRSGTSDGRSSRCNKDSSNGRCYTFTGPRQPAPTKRFALVTDFDKTLTDFDAGETIVERLAPELLPMLIGLDARQSYIPITNTILSEIQRRGVSRDQLLTALQQLGGELPLASVELLRMMRGASIDVKILSDCNSVFIGHILAGAKLKGHVQEVITNPAAFEWVAAAAPDGAGAAEGTAAALQRTAGQRLVILPHYDPNDASVVIAAVGQSTCNSGSGQCNCKGGAAGSRPRPHGCPRCPDNLCKGLEVERLLHANVYNTLVYCGDGANDVCAALALRPQDWLLARAGHPLAAYIEEARSNAAQPQVVARMAVWNTHEELLVCVRQVVDV
ncbi:hypothetical protein VaNZ11_005280 [Volvox africanus]|uniref:FCP1 homology domain-containing protein n=1 Tax=Volvox africanus TaxID=51714 RepID=A0ABQ5S002_9CHLO|nr:hypothetical protein VaNZ11_005280 [Volvox africanus]